MKISVLEPLGLDEKTLRKIADEVLGNRFEITFHNNRAEDVDTLIMRSKDADAVILSNISYKKDVIKEAKNLKFISVAFTGVDHIEMDYVKQKNILVSNSSGYANTAVTELVFGLIISLYRNIVQYDSKVRDGEDKGTFLGLELAGKTFGVVGAGSIGMNVANLARAFGCKVYLNSKSMKKQSDFEYLDLENLLKTCDIISLHLPLNDSSRGLISKKEFKIMKKDAILINTARGPIVDTDALVDALNKGEIAGAGIDVFGVEPPLLKDDLIFTAKNTVLTPHVAYATKEAMIKRAYIAFENVKKWADGNPVNLM